jgi:aldose 1-epimerase
MTVLAPGERLSREFRFTVERTGEAARRGRPRTRAGAKARSRSALAR